jgi:hypothetical protein
MKPVHQTDFDFTNGNCMAACIASILELPLEGMPNYHSDGDAWYHDWQTWLERYNVQLLTFADGGDWLPTGYSILSGQSPRHDKNHAVVCFNGEIVHDPHPDGTGVRDRREWTVFTVYDPALMVTRNADD